MRSSRTAMDLPEIIKELRRERDRIQKAIEALEAVATGESKRRGRQGMGDAERAAVSERMKRYWQKRKKKKDPPAH
jgi:hypothetical protein